LLQKQNVSQSKHYVTGDLEMFKSAKWLSYYTQWAQGTNLDWLKAWQPFTHLID